MAQIIDGKAHAARLKEAVREQVTRIAAPTLAVVMVGQDPASKVYIRNKQKACREVGITSKLYKLDENAEQDALLKLIDELNADADTHGILVQQPLPAGFDKHAVVSRIDVRKDVDCLHPHNIGLVMTGEATLLPCTPAGIVTLLKGSGVEIEGKHCVIIGRSDIVGKPLSVMLLSENATVTVCHSRTRDLPAVTQTADIVIAAAGRPGLLTADMIKPGCVVIDVGVNRLPDKKICGDADYEGCFEKASLITPVPGGVGPMTVATLMENCYKAWVMQHA